jgi:hypothetical protein
LEPPPQWSQTQSGQVRPLKFTIPCRRNLLIPPIIHESNWQFVSTALVLGLWFFSHAFAAFVVQKLCSSVVENHENYGTNPNSKPCISHDYNGFAQFGEFPVGKTNPKDPKRL